jgi:hypothetical protein
MALFVACHTHPPDSCPAASGRGAALLTHVSAANAARYRVAICAEALIDDEHRILFVLEAATREAVERFLAFLLRFGDLQVLPASTAEQAVGRGGCGTAKEAGWHTGAALSASVDARGLNQIEQQGIE